MKILFICSANICRSALAEVILRKKLREKGLADIEVDSAGVHNYAGEPRDYIMCSYACKAGYEMGGESKYISQEQADNADLVVCMEHFHVVEMQKGNTGYIYGITLQHIEEGCVTLAWKLSKMLREGELFF